MPASPPPVSLDSVTIVTRDFARSFAFYDAVLGSAGFVRAAEFGDEEEEDAEVEAAGWADDSGVPVLWLVHGTTPTAGAHVRVRARARADVESCYAAGLAAGGAASAAPRRWALYRRGNFSAAVADPEGNVVEAVSAE